VLDMAARRAKNDGIRARHARSKESEMSTAIVHASAPVRARRLSRAVAIAFGALALACGGAQAQGHGGFHSSGFHGGGYHGGYYRGGGWGFPFWGVGLGLGLGLAGAYYYDQPNYVVVNPTPYYYPPAAVPVYPAQQPAPAPAAAPMADPIFYPRNGQAAAQVEADRQACNRWATTQPRAMSDGSIFQRATLACMDGRGYTAR
jgi:hypothetical protein